MSDREYPVIELRSAFLFDCDACSRENIVRPVFVDMDNPEARERHGIEDEEMPEGVSGEWMTIPVRVACVYCGEVFDTKNPDDPDDEQGD